MNVFQKVKFAVIKKLLTANTLTHVANTVANIANINIMYGVILSTPVLMNVTAAQKERLLVNVIQENIAVTLNVTLKKNAVIKYGVSLMDTDTVLKMRKLVALNKEVYGLMDIAAHMALTPT